ncbi:sphingomyelinase C 2 [Fulvitalea axinellae]|uniref:Sphingomyelinase C 2 n=1 Tax=Fulvitalea axinellae TaxID=1182444 RepID=A0AAU9CG75_9BACT|nr:sphingomyelinase C 2 [Fulvitalea axinellae]
MERGVYGVLAPIFVGLAIMLASCESKLDDLEGEFSGQETALRNASHNRPEGISVLSHNLFLLPVDGYWNNYERVERMAEADYLKGYDVVVFQEVIHNGPVDRLLEKLKKEYPYQTPVMGRGKSGWDATLGAYSSVTFEDGGVVILSKWPIEVKKQYVYKEAVEYDYMANKGFAYAQVNKKGERYHIIGTHMQATHTGGWEKYAPVRAAQLKEMRSFMDGLPKDEMVLMAGDFNVIRESAEYPAMLDILGAGDPQFVGKEHSFDVIENQIIAKRYDGTTPEYLDYVLYSKNHKVPPFWQNLCFDPVMPKQVHAMGTSFFEYSDHYPVAGFMYAPANAPKASLRYREFDHVSFEHLKTGKYVTSRTDGDWDDYLKIGPSSPAKEALYNVIAKGNGDYNDIANGTLVTVEPSYKRHFKWNEYANTGIYPKKGSAMMNLALKVIKSDDGDINNGVQEGDVVAFVVDHAVGPTRYISPWPEQDRWKDYMFLWDERLTDNAFFVIHLNPDSREDWSGELVY